MKNDRPLVGSFHRAYRCVSRGLGRDHSARAHGLDGPYDIARRQRPAIVEAYARAQMKDQRQRVGLLPSFSQSGSEVKARVAGHQSIEEQLVNMLRLAVRSNARIEIRRTAVDEKDNSAGVAWRRAAAGKGQEADERNQLIHRSPDRGLRAGLRR